MSERDSHLFTSESVTEGHPDKVADQISDAVLDAVLRQDPTGRVACETLVTTGMTLLAGEITTHAYVDFAAVARRVIREIGYTRSEYGFDSQTCAVLSAIDPQSPDIAQGVDTGGAGDQGLMFGFACRETPELMPLPIALAHRLTRRLAAARRSGEVAWLRPDGKSQVTVEYEGNRPVRVHTVVISTQHDPAVSHEEIKRTVIEKIIRTEIPAELLDERTDLPHQSHGPLRGRRSPGRLRPDRAQDHRRHLWRLRPARRRRLLGQGPDEGGPLGLLHGAPRGQEPGGRRPRRAGRGAARLRHRRRRPGLGAGGQLRHRALGEGGDREMERLVREHFPLAPRGIIEDLDLRRPIYQKTASYGHFGRDDQDFRWESTHRAAALRAAAGLEVAVPA